MLDLIRTKQNTLVVKFVFWGIIAAFIGTIFLVWGKGNDGPSGSSSAAATVDGTVIPYENYQASYNRIYQMYQNVYKEQFTPALEKQLNLSQQAIDLLIDQNLLNKEAERRGISVSKNELVSSIASIPAFQVNGMFDKNQYISVLNYQRMTPDMFEAEQKRQLMIDKLRAQLEANASISEEDINEEFRRQEEEVNLSFINFAPPLFENKVSFTDEELETYFAENIERFRQPEKISLQYLQFEPARYEADLTFSSEETEKYYRQHLDSFEIEEQVEAAHILIKVPEDADDDTKTLKRELAEKTLKDLTDGKDFAETAKTVSDDSGSAIDGGKLGWFTRGKMVKAFEDAAFNLPPGKISGVVESTFGYHIIKVTGYIEPGVKPLADVIKEVREGLSKQKSQKVAYEMAMDTYNMNRKSGDLATPATSNDLGLKESGLFDRNGTIDGLGRNSEIIASAFALANNELARPVKTEKGIILFKVKERIASKLPELKDVKTQVESAYKVSKSADIALASANDSLVALKAGTTLSAIAKKYNLEVTETDLFTRSYGDFVPRIGSSVEIAESAFAKSESPIIDQVFTIGKSHYVVTIKEKIAPDMTALTDEKRAEINDKLTTKKKEDLFAAEVEQLRSAADISIKVSLEN